MNDPDFEDGAGHFATAVFRQTGRACNFPPDLVEVQIVGLADVLLEAGRDADAMSLLIQAQEAWNKFNMAFFLAVSDMTSIATRLAACNCGKLVGIRWGGNSHSNMFVATCSVGGRFWTCTI